MNTGSFLKRTKATELSDEELFILDGLFDVRDTFDSLVRENYASWHDLPYSHHLDPSTLRDTINRLVESGSLNWHTSGFDNRIFYGLTTKGGKLWEVERAPNWERYCTAYATQAETGQWMLMVETPSLSTAQAFMDCANPCGLYNFKQEAIRLNTLIEEPSTPIYWKTFSTLCSMSVPTHALPDPNQVDWPEYERRRSWWRGLTELAKFQGI